MKWIAVHEGKAIPVEVVREGTGYCVKLPNQTMKVDLVIANEHVSTFLLEDGRQFPLIRELEGSKHKISFGDRAVHLDMHEPLAFRTRRRADDADGSGNVNALMPGRVVKVSVVEGDVVPKGAGLLILEAMKMQNEIQAPRAGTVTKIFVSDGQAVESGAPLLTIE